MCPFVTGTPIGEADLVPLIKKVTVHYSEVFAQPSDKDVEARCSAAVRRPEIAMVDHDPNFGS